LLASTVPSPKKTYQLDLSSRGYQVLFWRDQVNHCPGCGKTQWHVGRLTAECGFCGTALAIDAATISNFELTGRKAVALHVVDGGKGDESHWIEKRKHERTPADGRTVMLHIDGSKHAFAIHNTSAGGLMGEALSGISEASSLVVELEDGTCIPAELKWSDGEFAGLAFLEPRAGS
jgi:hypothetical protein